MAKVHEKIHKVARRVKGAQVPQQGIPRGPKGVGVPPFGVQEPRRVGSNVKPPKVRKYRGG